jgi:hypothetical protein
MMVGQLYLGIGHAEAGHEEAVAATRRGFDAQTGGLGHQSLAAAAEPGYQVEQCRVSAQRG